VPVVPPSVPCEVAGGWYIIEVTMEPTQYGMTTQANRPAGHSAAQARTTILLADDSSAILYEVSTFLQTDFDVVATVSDGAAAVKQIADLQPDVIILDIAMPLLNGIEVAHEIRRRGLSPKIIFLSVEQDRDYVDAAAQIGASYVVKSRMRSDLILAIKETLDSRIFVSVPCQS